MIVTSTPLRMSFFGGGSDIPQYYNQSPGMVISTTIDKCIQIAMNRCQTDHIRAVYSEMEVVHDVDSIAHDRIRESLKMFGITNNIEICSFSDVPTKGTGLGSSSSFTVGMLNALYNHTRTPYNKRDLAEKACEIEIDRCGDPIGKQDQYAAAYGGFNVIRFDNNDVEVTPLNCSSDTLFQLNKNLFCYSTGVGGRKTSDILSSQVKNLSKPNSATTHNTKKIVDIAEYALTLLKRNVVDDFGALLHETWMQKRYLSIHVSNQHIDDMYAHGIGAGALGGKLLGAGGGGYMLFYVPEKEHRSFLQSMEMYKRFKFKFTDQGSTSTTL